MLTSQTIKNKKPCNDINILVIKHAVTMLIKKINIKRWFVYISVKFKGILFERIELISNYSRVFTQYTII
jgi:hypothetical protein